jgi:hypothetical protein
MCPEFLAVRTDDEGRIVCLLDLDSTLRSLEYEEDVTVVARGTLRPRPSVLLWRVA